MATRGKKGPTEPKKKKTNKRTKKSKKTLTKVKIWDFLHNKFASCFGIYNDLVNSIGVPECCLVSRLGGLANCANTALHIYIPSTIIRSAFGDTHTISLEFSAIHLRLQIMGDGMERSGALHTELTWKSKSNTPRIGGGNWKTSKRSSNGKIFICRSHCFQFGIGRLVFCILFSYITHNPYFMDMCAGVNAFAIESCAAHQKR